MKMYKGMEVTNILVIDDINECWGFTCIEDVNELNLLSLHLLICVNEDKVKNKEDDFYPIFSERAMLKRLSDKYVTFVTRDGEFECTFEIKPLTEEELKEIEEYNREQEEKAKSREPIDKGNLPF